MYTCTNVQAIGARNLLKSYAKQREAQQEQLRALIVEKKSELDRFLTSFWLPFGSVTTSFVLFSKSIFRLSTQHTALTKVEAEQQEFIEQFILQK